MPTYKFKQHIPEFHPKTHAQGLHMLFSNKSGTVNPDGYVPPPLAPTGSKVFTDLKGACGYSQQYLVRGASPLSPKSNLPIHASVYFTDVNASRFSSPGSNNPLPDPQDLLPSELSTMSLLQSRFIDSQYLLVCLSSTPTPIYLSRPLHSLLVFLHFIAKFIITSHHSPTHLRQPSRPTFLDHTSVWPGTRMY